MSQTKGAENRLLVEDAAVHGWYRFVLSFPPHLVRDYLERFEADEDSRVLDPFCGTGTTLVECKKQGVRSVGVEANPMAYYASRVKTDWSVDSRGLVSHSRRVGKRAVTQLEEQGINDEPFFASEVVDHTDLRQLTPEQQRLILKNSICPLPLHKTLVLIEALNASRNDTYIGHERLALARTLVESISNLHFGPEVGVRGRKKDTVVVGAWESTVASMARDLETVKELDEVETQVYAGDARDIDLLIENETVDIVITSPPYPNEKDYTRTTRLESVLLGIIENKDDLREMKQGFLRSNTRGVYVVDEDDKFVEWHHGVQRIAERIEARRIELGKTSGFERLYARLTRLYFGGMTRHLAGLRSALRPGAQLAYVVGDQASYLQVMIRTGKILGEIAEHLGYEVMGRDLFRKRFSTTTRQQLREEVLLLRWPG